MSVPERAAEGLRVLQLPLADGCRWAPSPGARGIVADYLLELLEQFWLGDAEQKYGMIGESDWQHDLYAPLRDAGLIEPWEDGWGPDHENRREAERLITAAIRALPYLRTSQP